MPTPPNMLRARTPGPTRWSCSTTKLRNVGLTLIYVMVSDRMLRSVMRVVALPPRILLVMPAQWPRALLRAALREEGYDASGTRAVNGALYQAAPDPARGPVRLVLADQDALNQTAVHR